MDKKKNKKIDPRHINIDNKLYFIDTLDDDTNMKKGMAYIIPFFNCVLPYRGEIDLDEGFDDEEVKPGIYSAKGKVKTFFAFPQGKKDKEKYSIENVKGNNPAIFESGDFAKDDILVNVEGEAFKPPIRPDDDMLLKIMKAAITLKDTPLSAYDKRFQNSDIGTNASNRKSNAKKCLLNNNSLSATKAVQFSDVMDLDIAITIRNRPNSVCPMLLEEGSKAITIYSNGEFDLSNSINVNNLADRLTFTNNSDDEE